MIIDNFDYMLTNYKPWAQTDLATFVYILVAKTHFSFVLFACFCLDKVS